MLVLLKKCMNGRGASMVIFLMFGPLQWAYFLSYNNIMYLKRSDFFRRFMIMKIKDTVQDEKLEKIQFYCFHPCHVGVLCSKTLTVNWHP